MRRFKDLDYKISSRKHLTIQRPVPPVFLGHRESPSPPRTPSGACWRSAAAAAQGSVLREADGQSPGQAPNYSWQHLIFDIQWQLSSVAQSCLTLCDPTDCSTPGFPVHHQLPELAQTHVRRVSDAIQPSHLLSYLSPPALNLSSIRVFSNESVLPIRWPKYCSFSFSISPSSEY